ncbi:MAG: heme lyase CcmF/NrfE family subunit, partial [Pseudomonadota bacterium]
MIVELGHYVLALALMTALAQTVLSGAGARRGDVRMIAAGGAAAWAQAGLLAASFAALIYAFAVSDFSVQIVVQNSHTDKPFLYKIAGAWGNHEGSMLLWVLLLAVFGAMAASRAEIPSALKGYVLSVQGLISVMFLAFVIFTSNPFARLELAPLNGQDLNPLLQDPALAIHPPMLYVGYVGSSIVFAFAIAGLILGRIDSAWARWARPWALLSWTALTVGIALGSYWAYYELGWGGWWYWDPVENASFMPWLLGAALIHSIIVTERRDALKGWTALLAILMFSLSLLGTFLVRSGVLTSVHAFALDPERGVFILAILVALTGGGLALFAWRAKDLAPGGYFEPVSRETAIVVNNLLLAVSCASVMIGTLYPLALEAATGDKISVGPPYFNMTFSLLIAPLLVLIPFGPLLSWREANAGAAARTLWAAAVIGFAVMAATAFIVSDGPVLAAVGAGVGVTVEVGLGRAE